MTKLKISPLVKAGLTKVPLLGLCHAVIVVLMVGSSASPAAAACSGSSPTRTAASASRTDVNDCLTAATSGDTIRVPAGSATWSSALTLPAKDLEIIGASVITCTNGSSSASPVTCTASNSTNITCSSGACFALPFTGTHRVSGFTILGASEGGFVSVYTSPVNSAKHFRIDHNRIVSNSGWADMQLIGGTNCVHPQGVIDNNIMVDISIQPQGTDPGDSLGEGYGDCQHPLWAQPPPLGSMNHVVYVERNQWQNTSGNINSMDSNHAGRYVARFNNITSGRHTFEIHGVQGSNRGSQLTEIYENAASGLSGFSGSLFWRGGTGVAFNNRQASAFSFGILFTNDRSELDDSIPTFGNCDGSHTGVDQNASGQRGWHCRDQPGVGYDATEWDHSPVRAWNQVLMPVYVWGNLTGGAAMDVDVDGVGDADFHIQQNRDFYEASSGSTLPGSCTVGQGFWKTNESDWNSLRTGADGRLYKCTSATTWTVYYTPLAYPHPWATGIEPEAPAPPTNLRITTSAALQWLLPAVGLCLLGRERRRQRKRAE
jgi:hypothetical protein